MEKYLYVAETDENGYVACVWVSGSEMKAAKVFDPKRHGRSFDVAEFAGASRQKIAAWIAAQSA